MDILTSAIMGGEELFTNTELSEYPDKKYDEPGRELTDHSNVEKYSQPEDKPAYDDRFAAMIVTEDPINYKNSDAKLRADAVNDESTEEITVAQVDSSAISRSEANKKLIKIMAQIRSEKSEFYVANLRANSNAIEERDFPEEQQSTTTLGAAIPEMGGDNTDTEQIKAIQKQEEISLISLIDNSGNVVRKYSELYLDLSCDLKESKIVSSPDQD